MRQTQKKIFSLHLSKKNLEIIEFELKKWGFY